MPLNTSNIRKKMKKSIPQPVFKAIYCVYKFFDALNASYVNNREKKKCNFCSDVYGINKEKREFDITVSFTTFPARIEQAKYVADAMLRQTLKPDRVLLVLAEDEFESAKALPNEYKNLTKRGLSIVFMENLKPHKKYYYALKHFPDTILITVDDDIFYAESLIETLFATYKNNPTVVSSMRTHKMKTLNGRLLPYNDWELSYTKALPSCSNLFATGGGGALYPPHSLHGDVLNVNLINKLSLNADDVWLKTMEVLAGTRVVLAKPGKSQRFVNIAGSQKTALFKDNVDSERNDAYIKKCLEYYELSVIEFMNGRVDNASNGQ